MWTIPTLVRPPKGSSAPSRPSPLGSPRTCSACPPRFQRERDFPPLSRLSPIPSARGYLTPHDPLRFSSTTSVPFRSHQPRGLFEGMMNNHPRQDHPLRHVAKPCYQPPVKVYILSLGLSSPIRHNYFSLFLSFSLDVILSLGYIITINGERFTSDNPSRHRPNRKAQGEELCSTSEMTLTLQKPKHSFAN